MSGRWRASSSTSTGPGRPLASTTPTRRWPPTTSSRVLARLEADGAITATTRRVLEQLAAGTATAEDRTADAARKQRWRAVVQVRANPVVVEALTA